MSTSSQNPETAFVVMRGQRPIAVATSLNAAHEDAHRRLTHQIKESGDDPNELDYHWSEHQPDEWRLLSKVAVPGRRFSRTNFEVTVVPTVQGGGEGA